MGSSFVSLQGVGYWTSDATLEVWLHFLVRELDKTQDPPPWLLELREDCHIKSAAGGSGWKAPDLDRLLTTDERRELLAVISEGAVAELERYGEYMTVGELNALQTGGEGSYFAQDCRTEYFKNEGRHFIKLLRGEIL